MHNTNLDILKKAFRNWANENVTETVLLPASGSKRVYYRISGKTKTALGAINADRAENEAFVSLSNFFASKNLNVPAIYFADLENDIYLIEDLGNTTLYDAVCSQSKENNFPENLIDIYKKVLKELPHFQIKYAKEINYNLCYPRQAFDKQSIQWDLSYFKYYFLKLADISFNEQLLENDFNTLTNYLLLQKSDFFLYRDFQSRNIMLSNNQLYFIDYQGGRKGALQYDVASLLYDAKAAIPQSIRTELLDFYINEIKQQITINETDFKQSYYAFVLMRIMQAMGAYGFRGFYERKTHFLQSIPYALENLKWILENINFPIKMPHLFEAYQLLFDAPGLKQFLPRQNSHKGLTIRICSFSYKKGLPIDSTDNGGGYIFDCRGNHNPGRYEQYKSLTGKDQAVIDFFAKQTDIHKFLNNIYSLIDNHVENYMERNFSHLMVNFGCTGGQHRSVYCAEQLAKRLHEKYTVSIDLTHREQPHL